MRFPLGLIKLMLCYVGIRNIVGETKVVPLEFALYAIYNYIIKMNIIIFFSS